MARSNIGVLAHVDAGKTSVTENLLFAAGVIARVGRVDTGDTQTDSMELERRRGITIRSAAVGLSVGGRSVNLIDTPGHPDFIAEVERVLDVLDGVVLVISAVEGVQAQTRILMRTLTELRLPTLLFVNKIDRLGADPGRVVADIGRLLSPAVIELGTVDTPGSRAAGFIPHSWDDIAFRTAVTELAAERDEDILAGYLEGPTAGRALSPARARSVLAEQTGRGLVHPIVFGSAVTGAGIDEPGALVDSVRDILLPPDQSPPQDADTDEPLSGRVFKIERDRGARVAYARIFSGCLRAREPVRYRRPDPATGEPVMMEGKPTAVGVLASGSTAPEGTAVAGDIAKVRGLSGVQIGDQVIGMDPEQSGRDDGGRGRVGRRFPPPTLESVVVPAAASDRSAVHAALVELAESDPLIGIDRDELSDQISVRLHGEVQKEVIAETLELDYGLAAEFLPTDVIRIERPVRAGSAHDFPDRRSPFEASVALRIQPARQGSGVSIDLSATVGVLPAGFQRAVEETIAATLRQGRFGWEVTDCAVIVTYAAPGVSPTITAGSYRSVTPVVVATALKRAGTVVCSPVQRFDLDVPDGVLHQVLEVLAGLSATAWPERVGTDGARVTGRIPAEHVQVLQRRLPDLTRGEGLLRTEFGGYDPLPGTPPSRPRRDLNPFDPDEYLTRLSGRLGDR